MSGTQPNMGLQLFPPPPKKKSQTPVRRPSVRRQAMSPEPQSAVESPQSPESSLNNRQTSLDEQYPNPGQQPTQGERAYPITVPPPVALTGQEMPRSHTSLSEAVTLVRSNSNVSHSSIAKIPYNTSTPRGEEPVMRSIFPRYNPDLPLEHQNYYPTQTSPTHIPKAVINRNPYSPTISDRSTMGLQSPMAWGAAPGRFPPGARAVQDEVIPETSTAEELKELWKVVNGWRVSASEGRTFCLKMNSAVEEPVHTLSSTTQPLYTLRLDPTSTSAQVTMLRHDPSKPIAKDSSPRLGGSKSGSNIEVMNTTLEETARRLPPNDGLVALLYPRAASNMVIELLNKASHTDDASVIGAAERECGRLVWDEDSQKHYLVHPATTTPFVITISSLPAWSRIEYTLEHPELPHNIVRLVRDGSGNGFLEVDTAAAAKIDCFYIVDVAICAVLLVAIGDEKTKNLERFDAPPVPAPISPDKSVKGKGKKGSKFESMEIDLESQDTNDSIKAKKVKTKEKKDKVPGCLGMIWMLIKCIVWCITICVKAFAYIIIGLAKCCTSSRKL